MGVYRGGTQSSLLWGLLSLGPSSPVALRKWGRLYSLHSVLYTGSSEEEIRADQVTRETGEG